MVPSSTGLAESVYALLHSLAGARPHLRAGSRGSSLVARCRQLVSLAPSASTPRILAAIGECRVLLGKLTRKIRPGRRRGHSVHDQERGNITVTSYHPPSARQPFAIPLQLVEVISRSAIHGSSEDIGDPARMLAEALLGRKRRSDKVVDENEDGGRAIVIEEGIAALVFAYAAQHDYLNNVTRLDQRLLDTITMLASVCESRVRTSGDWEHAILAGFACFRELLAHNGGSVRFDADAGSLDFLPSTG